MPNNHTFNPYIISIDFDVKPEYLGDNRWIAGAVVDLGDKNSNLENAKRISKLKINQHPDSMGYEFLFYVCSPEYKENPEKGYEIYSDIFYVQNEYNPKQAGEWLLNRINSIGQVDENTLTENLHQIFNTEDWDFDLNR